MNFFGTSFYPPIKYCINGQDTVKYIGGFKYTGKWENGRKVGEGFLEIDSIKLKVKTKEGRIHKCIEVLNKFDSSRFHYYEFPLPNLEIIKQGNNYKEVYSDTKRLSFLLKDNEIFFYGTPYSFYDYLYQATNIGEIMLGYLKDSNCPRTVIEIKTCQTKLVVPSINFIPNGDCKILYQSLKIKGKLKGIFFGGLCIVKYPNYQIIFEIYLNQIKFPIKIISGASKVVLFFGKVNNSLSAILGDEKKSEITEIQKEHYKNSIIHSCEILNKLTTGKYFSYIPKIVSYLLVVDTNWMAFEQKSLNNRNCLNFSIEQRNQMKNQETKSLKLLKNNERFEGGIRDGKFEGFGKYFYSDGSVYVGEFKNNLRNGIGVFKFRDGRMYRGQWVDDLMHGKGCMLNRDTKVYGILERNKTKKGSFSLLCNLGNRIE